MRGVHAAAVPAMARGRPVKRPIARIATMIPAAKGRMVERSRRTPSSGDDSLRKLPGWSRLSYWHTNPPHNAWQVAGATQRMMPNDVGQQLDPGATHTNPPPQSGVAVVPLGQSS